MSYRMLKVMAGNYLSLKILNTIGHHYEKRFKITLNPSIGLQELI